MNHVDLFSGIGGFSLAFDRVFYEQKNKHIFVEWDDFCQEVLKKHWSDAEYHKDIRQFVADAKIRKQQQLAVERKQNKKISSFGETYLLTGGFPCQPFSQAGRRQGTSDDRYLWPPMFEAISIFKPRWVIAENVEGLVTWNDGLVLETVCSDLEREGYEVQPFVIPACAVGAPHRRDRVWIVAKNSNGERGSGWSEGRGQILGSGFAKTETERSNSKSWSTNTKRPRYEGNVNQAGSSTRYSGRSQWDTHWFEVATRLCRVDDGIPRRLDRNSRLKALGNAIVPQVAEEILGAIKYSEMKI